MKISVLIPVYNYEETLESTINTLSSKKNIFEILLVWDVTKSELRGKIDKLAEKLIKKYKIRIIFRHNQKGFGSALRLGFQNVKGDAVVVMMADLCDDPKTIDLMEKEIQKGYDIVSGCRYCKGGGIVGNTFKQKVSSTVSLLINIFSRNRCRDLTNAFKMYRTQVLKEVETKANFFDISIELPLKALRKGFKISQVPTVWKNRNFGKSNFNFGGESKRYIKWFLYAVATKPSFVTIATIIILIASIAKLLL